MMTLLTETLEKYKLENKIFKQKNDAFSSGNGLNAFGDKIWQNKKEIIMKS